MDKKIAILWFRQDLRLHDNEALIDALDTADEIYPIYVFDERHFNGYGRHGFRRIGKERCRFILESVMALRDSLRKMGSELIVRVGKPEEEIYNLALKVKSSWVFCNRERTPDEVQVQDALEEKLWSIGQEMRFSRGKMLYYTQDLPFPITHVPDHFTAFKKEVERIIPIRMPFRTPTEMPRLSVYVDAGKLPELENFGWDSEEELSDYPLPIKGGEQSALDHVKEYLRSPSSFARSNAKIDVKCSYVAAFLTHGCLSPKTLYWLIKDHQETLGSMAQRFIYELLIRDFFRLQVKKHGELVFQDGGMQQGGDEHLVRDRKKLLTWTNARTHEPYVNAYMRQLNETGYMPQIGRLCCAVHLIHTLGVHWQFGAEYFEAKLIDYDPCSNWANWNLIAGVASEYKDFSQYNVDYQSRKQDPDGLYLARWSQGSELSVEV